MRFTLTIIAFFMFTSLPGMLSAQEEPAFPELTDEERELILEGEIIVDTIRARQSPTGLNRGQSVGMICAPIDELLEIVQDFENQSVWFPDMEESIVIDREARIGQGRTHMPWPLADRRWQITAQISEEDTDLGTAYVMQYEYIEESGNMDEMHGYWIMMPWENDCVLMRYVINADLGMALPDAIINWASRRLLPGVITGLTERHAELY